MVDMHAICADLHAEHTALDTLLVGLDEAGWNTPTPAPGWMVRDQISHIGSTDRTATIAAAEPQRFHAEIAAQPRERRSIAQLEVGRSMSGAELLAWWRARRSAMLEVFGRLDAKTRIPWFGPAMSAVSFATARLMETWAHGQDIVDALGLSRPATERLRHVAYIGVLARPFSYTTRGRAAPPEPVYVALQSPSGDSLDLGGCHRRQPCHWCSAGFLSGGDTTPPCGGYQLASRWSGGHRVDAHGASVRRPTWRGKATWPVR